MYKTRRWSLSEDDIFYIFLKAETLAFTPNHMDSSWDLLFRQRADEYALYSQSVLISIYTQYIIRN